MRDPHETAEIELDAGAHACLRRTRSGVLNVLIAVGVVIAVTGVLLRNREGGMLASQPEKLGGILHFALVGLLVVCTVLRRALGRRARLRDPDRRAGRFYWGHVAPAALGALAAPLGLAYGWMLSPRLEAILPFWLGALVLGVLSYPRGHELEGLDAPLGSVGGSPQ